jgi:D-aspartate ligase
MSHRRPGGTPVVLLGSAVNALWAARSFARAGIEVYALGDGMPAPVVFYSRRLSGGIDFPRNAALDELWTPWLARLRHPAVLLPTGDPGVEYIAHHRKSLVAMGHAPVEADDAISLGMLDKQATYNLARSRGIEVPRTVPVGSIRELRQAATEIGYPCALKPVSSYRFASRFHAKALVAGNWGELESGARRVFPSGLNFLLTEIIPGEDEAYCSYYTYMDETGGALFHLTKHKIRQWPIGFGLGTYHVTGWVPDAAALGLQFFTGIGLRGVGNVEFKRDCRDGRLKLIECNVRLTAADQLLRRAGVDLARIAYERALGRKILGPASFREGLRQWHVADDVLAFLALRRQGRLDTRSWLRSVLHAQTGFQQLDLRDPVPSVVGACRFARRVARQAGRRPASAVTEQPRIVVVESPAPRAIPAAGEPGALEAEA